MNPFKAKPLKEKRLPLVAMTVVLTTQGLTEGWRPLKQAIIEQLAKQPADAVSLLAQAQSIAGWPVATFTVKHEGPDHARTFMAEASLPWEGKAVVGHGKGANAKLARQLAAIDLLAQMGGCAAVSLPPTAAASVSFRKDDTVTLTRPVAGLVPGVIGVVVAVPGDAYEVEFITATGRKFVTVDLDAVTQPDTKDPPKADGGTSRDPVSVLMEHVAKAKLATPDFMYEKMGPDHAPVITCTCRMGTIVRSAKAGTKQDAKKQAATAVLNSLKGYAHLAAK